MKTNFVTDHAKAHYYTGLPNGEVLLATFNYIVPYPGVKRDYHWKSFIILLMKLRLNVGFQDLTYRLDVSVSTVSRRFHEMLHIAYNQLDFFIYWPVREELQKTMPLCFHEAYGLSVACIIDCYEIRIEKPSNLVA